MSVFHWIMIVQWRQWRKKKCCHHGVLLLTKLDLNHVSATYYLCSTSIKFLKLSFLNYKKKNTDKTCLKELYGSKNSYIANVLNTLSVLDKIVILLWLLLQLLLHSSTLSLSSYFSFREEIQHGSIEGLGILKGKKGSRRKFASG